MDPHSRGPVQLWPPHSCGPIEAKYSYGAGPTRRRPRPIQLWSHIVMAQHSRGPIELWPNIVMARDRLVVGLGRRLVHERNHRVELLVVHRIDAA